MDESLQRALVEAAAAIFQPTDVVLAYAFGSRVGGKPRPDSDLDVGYYLDDFRRHPPLPIQTEMLLAEQLSRKLGLEVDLRDLGRAPLAVRGRVLEEGVRIFSRDEAQRVDLERDLLGRYHDYKEIFERLDELRFQQFAQSGLQ